MKNKTTILLMSLRKAIPFYHSILIICCTLLTTSTKCEYAYVEMCICIAYGYDVYDNMLFFKYKREKI